MALGSSAAFLEYNKPTQSSPRVEGTSASCSLCPRISKEGFSLLSFLELFLVPGSLKERVKSLIGKPCGTGEGALSQVGSPVSSSLGHPLWPPTYGDVRVTHAFSQSKAASWPGWLTVGQLSWLPGGPRNCLLLSSWAAIEGQEDLILDFFLVFFFFPVFSGHKNKRTKQSYC